jgi:glycosyltransferase involved in cell wall biosynthesis
LVTSKPKLVFVSPRFLFPTDSGGKIRTTQILRGLKGGRFEVELLMPSTAEEREQFRPEIEQACDMFRTWRASRRTRVFSTIRRASYLLHRFPVSVASDNDARGRREVRDAIAQSPDVIVFDFPHSAVLAPVELTGPSVLFTHNIEAEIFKRHVIVARNPLARAIWGDQYRKMLKFERQTLRRFTRVVAVSERDREFFANEFGIETSRAIPTGVDTEFFRYEAPADDKQVVFCGSMDWMANVDGIEFFHDKVWPEICGRVPGARMKVVGRTPPESLVRRIAAISPDWQFTGFVDDVRDHVAGAAAFVIPLRVGGGTRIKAFEAMAMGTPVVSTSIGIEGLPVEDGTHYLNADSQTEMAARVTELLQNPELRNRLSRSARELVESRFGFRNAAAVFEEICLEALDIARSEE